MKITYLGHAGLYIESKHGSILCDPWFNPAFFTSWFPFPDNSDIDPKSIGNPDYLYISHQHHDHLDPVFLRDHVSKDVTVLLPDFPMDHLRRDLEKIGFIKFIQTKNGEVTELGKLKIAIIAEITPSDGPTGDSGLFVDDGETRIFNQNDSHPKDIEALKKLGKLDAHFLQFSGAIWYPMVYNFPETEKKALGKRKRANQMSRAYNFLNELDAKNVFPSAGPPCFLDQELFYLNDFENDESNIFYDQTVFLDYMIEKGNNNGKLAIPGSVISLEDDAKVKHPIPDALVDNIFKKKKEYLKAYQERKLDVIEKEKRIWPSGTMKILDELKNWFEPLMEIGNQICTGINARVLLDLGREKIILDFLDRKVYEYKDELYRFKFTIDPRLVEACILEKAEDWSNKLFLSCRFEAEREDQEYNEYVYIFFKALSAERMKYVNNYYASQTSEDDFFECGDYLVQKHCPHLQSDLTVFGEVQDGILTCTMHGWQFELDGGKCLTSDDRRLQTKKIEK